MNKINQQILSIPPYISTSWDEVTSIFLKQQNPFILAISLKNGSVIDIPGLSSETVALIFQLHQKNQMESPPSEILPTALLDPFTGGSLAHLPLKNLELMLPNLQHQAELAHTPDMPEEIRNKITLITQGLIESLGEKIDALSVPEAEPHCNCMYCQVARVVKTVIADNPEEGELENSCGSPSCPPDDLIADGLQEPITPEELSFRDNWIIEHISDQIYTLKDAHSGESCQVYLGTPSGCTCGRTNCEHIQIAKNQ